MSAIQNEVEVGQGATLLYPQDKYPYVVTAVSPSRKSITVRRLSTNGLSPTGQCNGFPVFDYVFNDSEERLRVAEGKPSKAYLRKSGMYYLGGTPLFVGRARYFRNYAD